MGASPGARNVLSLLWVVVTQRIQDMHQTIHIRFVYFMFDLSQFYRMKQNSVDGMTKR